MFNKAYYVHLAAAIGKSYPAFRQKEFIEQATRNLSERALNQRLRHTAQVMRAFLPADYKTAIKLLYPVVEHTKPGYTNLVFPDFVALYGLADFKTSLEALKHFTCFGSSEFAIRVYLKHDFDTTLNTMYKWAHDANHHVRRLSSEGSRPRLPWSFKLEEVIKNPALTQPILETLKADTELYVRKSVANHLNDISKENPDYMVNLVSSWNQNNPHTAWIVKHASRTLIKKGHSASLQVFNFEKHPKVSVAKLKLNKATLKLGETLAFSFDLQSGKSKPQKLVVDYVLHYRKKQGGTSPKVFKLKELELPAKANVLLDKKQKMVDFTTRKHYPGKHRLEIQVNGKVMAGADFELKT